ncbi:cbb3-type cytochrome c oxidase subunit II [Pseudodonghicola flavimaris]|uniref:Cbb3-type cytochrome c oxidase subunit II n=1 Tax=Pseudodonghicola flavimaris TaxID=3050036 RepID=A0ABT7F2R0_9RHOB|nr:cbb3-type cytochrome c oxidase subunit II [Pseudodonghicola flavimaris]MDK3018904.1 cbb3-type cytochrome c oxidase subunit II [Pseudodonghicola flavimaris]
MNRYLPLALLAFGILAFATLMLVIAPGVQIARHSVPPQLEPYTEQQARGRAQYVGLGCVYCHSQQPRSPDQAPDGERGWGRPAVAADYVYDQPHQLGTMRTGPDLLNVGARLPSEAWQLTHLYQPRAIFGWSVMPAYPFLFEIKPAAEPGDTVVVLPEAFAPEAGVVVARQEALDLTAYLLSLDRTYPAPADALRDEGYATMESGS